MIKCPMCRYKCPIEPYSWGGLTQRDRAWRDLLNHLMHEHGVIRAAYLGDGRTESGWKRRETYECACGWMCSSSSHRAMLDHLGLGERVGDWESARLHLAECVFMRDARRWVITAHGSIRAEMNFDWATVTFTTIT